MVFQIKGSHVVIDSGNNVSGLRFFSKLKSVQLIGGVQEWEHDIGDTCSKLYQGQILTTESSKRLLMMK